VAKISTVIQIHATVAKFDDLAIVRHAKRYLIKMQKQEIAYSLNLKA
jgi:hypothetical protein